MSVYFSSACHDERGKYNGGQAGDQTRGEVRTAVAYNHKKGWRIFRHPDSNIAYWIGTNAKAIADNSNFGYDQGQRDTGYSASKNAGWEPAKVTTPCELDCSSMVRTCIACAMEKDIQNFNTASEPSVLLSLGFKEITGTPIDQLVLGDIVCTPVKGHTEIVSVSSNAHGGVGKNYYPRYTGSSVSIVVALGAVGEKNTSYAHRKKIAVANGISGYSGTAEQNTHMLNLLKAGRLAKA